VPLTDRWAHPRVPGRRPWTGNGTLMIFPRGRAHALWFFRGPESRGWYVNLEDPAVFGERAISTRDHVLDISVPFDTGRPQWRGEEGVGASTAGGGMPPEGAAAARAEGERVMRERPWPTGWEEFEPDPAWPRPTLFDGWDVP